ncbi:MAG: hypothetical protein J6Y94_03970 [Bacteriovoracaceae bacterium]|nr:hypothetical protein [Bacteriovoracaceae bacterium]
MNIKKILKTAIRHEDFMVMSLKGKDRQKSWIETNIGEFTNDGNLDAFLRCVEYVIKARGQDGCHTMENELVPNKRILEDILDGNKRPSVRNVSKLISGLGYRCHASLQKE